MISIEDPLWPHFEPLWKELTRDGGRILVAGGYGLFLKQRWLAEERMTRLVVPLERWTDVAPRVTKDLDLVVGLDLIADRSANAKLLETLERAWVHGVKKGCWAALAVSQRTGRREENRGGTPCRFASAA